MLETTFGIIKKAFQETAGRKEGREITPLKPIAKVETVKQIKVFRPSLNLVLDNNGYIEVNFRIKKSQKELLNRILQETILK